MLGHMLQGWFKTNWKTAAGKFSLTRLITEILLPFLQFVSVNISTGYQKLPGLILGCQAGGARFG